LARRYIDDAGRIAGWASVVLERLGVPPTMSQPAQLEQSVVSYEPKGLPSRGARSSSLIP